VSTPAGLLVAAGVCVACGATELVRSYTLVRAGKRTRGRLSPGKPREGEDDADPPLILHFRTESGLDVELPETTRSKADDAKIGAEVVVIYLPSNPRRARRDTFGQLWIPGLVWLAFAAILGLAALASSLLSPA
jgi:hypothetical protein